MVSSSAAVDHAIMAADAAKTVRVDKDKLRRTCAELERQVERLIELYQVGSIPMASITQRVNDLTAQKAALESQLNAPDEIPAKELFLAAVEDYRKGFADGDTDRKRALLSGLLERVTIDGQSIQLHWRL